MKREIRTYVYKHNLIILVFDLYEKYKKLVILIHTYI